MLQSIRESAQGWIAWVIVILISIPFALWGIQEYLGIGEEATVASVNGRKIAEREFESTYQRFRQNLRQQLGEAFQPDLFPESKLRADVLESMIRNELVLQAARRMGLRVGDAALRRTIAGVSDFQTNGQFDPRAYERSARQQGYSTADFQERIREALVSDQLTTALTGSELVTKRELEEAARLRDQRRELSYLLLPASDFVKPGGVSEEDIQAYYAANQGKFMAPERVRLDYLELKLDQLSGDSDYTEEELRAFYEDHRGEYTTPEQRRASHILIAIEGEGEDAENAAREKAREVLKRLRDGEDFAALAKEVSQDAGSAGQGGDLGFIEAGMMSPAFDKALFALGEGEVSEPVRTDFGFHIIKLTDLIAGTEKSFEEVRDKVLQAYRSRKAEGLFYKYSERLVDLTYENPDSLEPAADALGLKVVTTDWLTRADAAKIPGGAKSIAAAFGEDVLDGGNNSELIEISPEDVLVLRVHDHEEASILPLEQVRDTVVAALEQQQSAKLAREMGEALLKRLRQGESMELVAGEVAHKLESPGSVGRNDSKLPRPIAQTLFSMPRPGSDETLYGKAVLNNGDFAIIALHKVQDGSLDKLDEKALQDLKVSLLRTFGRENFEHLVQNLRDAADVNISRSQEQ
ncbi:MAG TPA: peptidylprolyl isomerase [Sedimenticola sp.]|nr:peptidylprolyl isomerase [Sedimenticola sp.]